MYYTSGFEECLSNLVVLANAHSTKRVRTGVDLAAGVRAFAIATSAYPAAAGPLHLVDNEAQLRLLARQFGREPANVDDPSLHAPLSAVRLFWDGLALLPASAQQLFQLLVTEVALLNGKVVAAGSGALLDKFGTVYVAPEPDWRGEDIAECLTHEMTHLLLRCDENRYGHYTDPVDAARPQEFGPSAVTLSMRSPTVVFHSLVVAAEILALRSQQRVSTGSDGKRRDGVHGSDETLISNALRCADAVLQRADRDQYYTDRAVLLMTRAADRLRAALPTRAS